MGVSGLITYICASFPKAVRYETTSKDAYDHICIDLNSVVHDCCNTTPHEDFVILNLFDRLDSILKRNPPSKSILLALDGPGPAAKLKAQIQRRYKSSGKQKFDTAQLSPGTIFMSKLKEYLVCYACYLLQKEEYANIHVEISGAEVPGEGEIKIAEYILRTNKTSDAQGGDKYLIHSSDSDAILIAISTLSENVEVLTNKESMFFSTGKMMDYFRGVDPTRPARVAYDFILACILNGNDYLPEMARLPFARLWKQYRRLKEKPKFENQFLLNEDRTLNYSLFSRLIKGPKDAPPQNHHRGKSKKEEKHDSSEPKALSEPQQRRIRRYLEGLQWNIAMYWFGRCPDYSYVYLSFLAPPPQEIRQWLSTNSAISCEWPMDEPLTPLQFGVLITPFFCRGYLPSPVHSFNIRNDRIDETEERFSMDEAIQDVKEKLAPIAEEEYDEEERDTLRFGTAFRVRKVAESDLTLKKVPKGFAAVSTKGVAREDLKIGLIEREWPRPDASPTRKRKAVT
eukprot:TRINITY_DN8968_c0_g1_i1.p1 TRINITY_DN8968_c0_g1~~TRINITY_DN8968_c0_g1_i1.p1  ORF type:complete len:512 (-),score=99.65 TRINITY_DN8968_c0_g1_i1:1300-2835(-)